MTLMHICIYANWTESQRRKTLFHQTGISYLPRQGSPQANYVRVHSQTQNNGIEQHGEFDKITTQTHKTI
jgi:hypothetical protein